MNQTMKHERNRVSAIQHIPSPNEPKVPSNPALKAGITEIISTIQGKREREINSVMRDREKKRLQKYIKMARNISCQCRSKK